MSTAFELATKYAYMPWPATVRSWEHSRSADAYNSVLDQFDVAYSARYRPRDGNTYCKTFAWDVTCAMNCEVPHWIDVNGEPTKPGAPGAKEILANYWAATWLPKFGPGHGWRKVTFDAAQDAANRGLPTMAIRFNPRGHGHVAMVIPRVPASPPVVTLANVEIAQAGAHCFRRGILHEPFSFAELTEVVFWSHA